MATKTITLELDAYDRLRKAKRSERESFSEVVRRAVFPEAPMGGGDLLAFLKRRGAILQEAELDAIEKAHAAAGDLAADPWEEVK